MKDEYNVLAEKMFGIIGIGAIDCIEDEELCEEFSVMRTPVIMVYSESYTDIGE